MSKRSETRDPKRSCKGRNELSSSLAEEKVDRQKTLPQAGGEARQQITAWDDSASKSGLTKTQKEKKKKGNAHSSGPSSLPTKRNWRRAGTSEKCRVKTRTKEQRVKSARGEGNGRRERT
jgi:hypothetical protein